MKQTFIYINTEWMIQKEEKTYITQQIERLMRNNS